MIYVFLADGFEEIEAVSIIDVLRRADLDITTVGIGSKKIKGAHNIEIIADIEEDQIEIENIDCVVLPGGMPGTLNLENSSVVTSYINYCVDNNKFICAICAAPLILGHMGILKDKEAVCFPGFESDLIGAKVVEKQVVVDKNIITAKGPGVAIEFALKIVELLKTKKISNSIRMSMQCI